MSLSRPFGNLGIGIAKKIFLPSEIKKKKKKKSRIFMFFLALSDDVSTTLLQILSSLRFPVHQVKGADWCSRKKLLEHSEASWCFKKTIAPKISAYFASFPAKHPSLSSFKYTCRPSWDYSKKLFRVAILQTRVYRAI